MHGLSENKRTPIPKNNTKETSKLLEKTRQEASDWKIRVSSFSWMSFSGVSRLDDRWKIFVSVTANLVFTKNRKRKLRKNVTLF